MFPSSTRHHPRRDVRRVATARLISLTGSEAAFTALLFVLYRRTGSATWLSAALLLTMGTEGLFSLIGGSLGDRHDRRLVMIVSDLAGAACFAALAFARDPLHLVLLAFLAAAVESPFFPAASGAVPNLVVGEDLAWANATIAFGSNVGYLVGPALGGVLVAAVGAPAVFGLNAASFIVSALLVRSVRHPFSLREEGSEAHRGIRAGFRFIRRDPVLRRMLGAFAVFAVCIGSVLVAELPLATSFGVGSVGFGLLATSFGLGALIGALVAKRFSEVGERRALVFGSFVTAAAFASVALAPVFAPVLLAMLVAGTSDGMVDVAVEVIYQRRSPDAVRSRVVATLEATWHTGLALSFLFAGWLIDSFGPKMAYILGGVGCAVCALILLPLRRLDRPAHSPPESRPATASAEPPDLQ
jgi:MFS family permease